MKKLLSVVLSIIMIFSLTTVFAEEEFSDSANIEYDYDESYDESVAEDTTSKYDNIDTFYDSSYDESKKDDSAAMLIVIQSKFLSMENNLNLMLSRCLLVAEQWFLCV